jgi:hypothetical protein
MVNDSCYDFDTRCDCCRVYITGSNRACSTHHYIFLLSPRSCSGSNGHSHRREKAQTVEDIRIDGRAPTSHLNGQRISLSTFWLSFVGTVESVSRRDPSRSYACPSATVPRRGDPQVTSPADHGGLRHLRRTMHPPLARHPCGLFSSLFLDDCMLPQHPTMVRPDVSRAFGRPPKTSIWSLCVWEPISPETFLGARPDALLGQSHALLSMFGALSVLRYICQQGLGRGAEFNSACAFFVLMGVACPGAGVTGIARVDRGVNPCWVHVCAGWVSTTQPQFYFIFIPGIRPEKPIIDSIISLTTHNSPMNIIGCHRLDACAANNPKCIPSPWRNVVRTT